MKTVSRKIPTLSEVLAEQENLAGLCADRPLATTEIFSGNAYYGTDFVLKSYADVTLNRPLKCVLPHGIPLHEESIWSAENQVPLPVILYYPSRLAHVYREKSGKVALRGASPFLYVSDLIGGQTLPTRKGTLFFLSHSSHWVTAVSEFESLAETLGALPEQFHPITVCIYWRDFNLGHHLPFVRRGLKVMSAGHIYDPHFLIRFHYLCSMHQYSCSNELGSHLFMSVKAGCAYFHLPGNARQYHAESGKPAYSLHVPIEVLNSLDTVFAQPRDNVSPEQLAIVDDYVGAAKKLTPQDMRTLLQFCERLDRFGTGTLEGRRYFAFPRIIKRALWYEPKQRLRKMLKNLLLLLLRRCPGSTRLRMLLSRVFPSLRTDD